MSVNEATAVSGAPPMKCGTFLRMFLANLFELRRRFPRERIGLWKIDVSACFRRFDLDRRCAPLFVYPIDKDVVAISLKLQMGGVMSPAYASYAGDLITAKVSRMKLSEGIESLPLGMETESRMSEENLEEIRGRLERNEGVEVDGLRQVRGRRAANPKKPVAMSVVNGNRDEAHVLGNYVDDECGAALAGNGEGELARNVHESVFGEIFKRTEGGVPKQDGFYVDPYSHAKHEDTIVSNAKEIIGVQFETDEFVVAPTAARAESIIADIDAVLAMRKGAPYKMISRLNGKICHVAQIRIGRGLFTRRLSNIATEAPWRRRRMGKKIKEIVVDLTEGAVEEYKEWRQYFVERPGTWIEQLVEREPDCYTYSDASVWGMGGWFESESGVGWWRWEFSPGMRARFKTQRNPDGTANINLFEALAAGITVRLRVAEEERAGKPTEGLVVANYTDNVSAAAWTNNDKPRTRTAWAMTRKDLEFMTARKVTYMQRSIPGVENTLADDTSRRWNWTAARMSERVADLMGVERGAVAQLEIRGEAWSYLNYCQDEALLLAPWEKAVRPEGSLVLAYYGGKHRFTTADKIGGDAHTSKSKKEHRRASRAAAPNKEGGEDFKKGSASESVEEVGEWKQRSERIQRKMDSNEGGTDYMRRWRDYAEAIGVDPHLRLPAAERCQIGLHYMMEVREGRFFHAKQVKKDNVLRHMAAAADVCRRACKSDPWKDVDGRRFRCHELLEKVFAQEDPSTVHKCPAPPALVLEVIRESRESASPQSARPRERRIGDLTELAFLWMLRACEYCDTGKKGTRKGKGADTADAEEEEEGCATMLNVGSVAFLDAEGTTIFANGRFLTGPTSKSGLAARLGREATSVSLLFVEQKNNDNAVTRVQNKNPGAANSLPLCPLRAAARVVEDILMDGGGPLTKLCKVGKQKMIKSTAITASLRAAVDRLGHTKLRLTKEMMTAHCLRTGGCMAFWLANVEFAAIRLLGRWKSDAILDYMTAVVVNYQSYAEKLTDCLKNFVQINTSLVGNRF
ncbi:hypothetical protein TeGR_g1434 [Tetraparma gracilis]|uniref:Reverse transcriptase domain-containing protein n=1 Tax=Tetraparma gracilis TaxID=2962635 RepID=A0ABQ6MYD4_9STRA|nr:hypothetical protein TeGR_g1434 [Tetraparma gracilis]